MRGFAISMAVETVSSSASQQALARGFAHEVEL
jgi:hypothetical protein